MATTVKKTVTKTTSTKGMGTAKPIEVAKPAEVAAYTPGEYESKYQPQIDASLDKVTNWSYDPMQDANYQALSRVYSQRGNIAAKNSLADAAALNGGYGTSYAVSAAQQARNQYNQELASMIPELENTAYNRALGTLQAYREADDTDYGRFRDTEGDRQWAWTNEYNKYRDLMSDYQWGMNYNYQLDRDKVSDERWAMEYAKSKKSGSGGRRSSGSGGSGYYSTGSGVDLEALYNKAKEDDKKKKTSSTAKGKTLTAKKTASPQTNKLVKMER